MLVKHNLLLNGDKLKMPNVGIPTDDISFKNGKIYFNNITNYIVNFIEKEVIDNLELTSDYFVGVYGKLDGNIQMYKGSGYKNPKSNNGFYYIPEKGNTLKGPLHIRSYEGYANSGVIKALAIYKDSPPDVYLPNVKSLQADKQAYYPPEGDYKEIQPMRG